MCDTFSCTRLRSRLRRFCPLCAAVPAAMKIALPQAEAGIYLTLSLGVTFPFNITLGLPMYLWLAGLG